MLLGIPKLLSPELLKILCEMGHGDTIVIGDGNFPAAACAKRLVRLDGHGTADVLKAILEIFPLDGAPNAKLGVMATDDGTKPNVWKAYESLVKILSPIERFAFYEEAKNAYCIIATSETALYANIVLTKGVV